MIRLDIKSVLGYNYLLVDNEDKEYNVNIEFYGIDENPMQGDILFLNEDLLNDINNNMVSFGPLGEKYGKDISSNSDKDVVYLSCKNGAVYLKRFYG